MLNTKILLLSVKPKLAMVRPINRIHQFFYDVAVNFWFEGFILLSIVANSVTLTFHLPNMSGQTRQAIDLMHVVFTVIFTLEAAVKLIAFQSRYFKDRWNVFDFAILCSSLVLLLFSSVASSFAPVIRSVRVGRLLKLVKKMKQLKIIFRTFLNTISCLLSVGTLMFLVIYLYAVVGVTLFADIKLNEPLHERLNFQSVSNALLVLLTVATGDGWNEIMDAIGRGKSQTNDCVRNAGYADYERAGETVGCGEYWITYIYFVTYVILISLIFLNLFIAIIMNGYFETREKENQVINQEILSLFRDTWSVFDPDATGKIKVSYFPDFMFMLGPGLGWDDRYHTDLKRQERSFNIVTGGLRKYTKETDLHFLNIIDNIFVQYIVRQEVKMGL